MDAEGTFVHKVADLAAEYGVRKSLVPSTVREHCTARSGSRRCVECGVGAELTSRSAFQAGTPLSGWQCADCRTQADAHRRQSADALRDRQASVLAELYEAPTTEAATDFGAYLGLRDAVLLLSLIRRGAAEDLDHIVPRRSWQAHLMPGGDDEDYEVLADLFKRGFLRFSARSQPDAFAWEGDDPARYYPDSVAWNIVLEGHVADLAALSAALEQRLRGDRWPIHWELARDSLWREVALSETLAYLAKCLDDHTLSLHVGEKTRLVLSTALEDFSIGQVNGFCWRAAKDAAAFYVAKGVTKPHAANTVIGAIQRSAERARTQGWDVKSFGRDWDCPPSAVSDVLAHVAFGTGDDFLATRISPDDGPAHRAATLDDTAALLGLTEDELTAQLGGVDLGFEDLRIAVDRLNQAIDRGAGAWAVAFPVGPSGQPTTEPVATAVAPLTRANVEVDEAIDELRRALDLPSTPPPANLLKPRSAAYFVAQLETAADQLEKKHQGISAAQKKKQHQRKSSKAARKRSRRR